jgi:hypothetical protein
MPKQMLPRIAEVAPGEAPLTLRLRWRGGGESQVDVSGLVRRFRIYAPLSENSTLFREVRVGEHGTDVAWTDEIDMSADTLWRLAHEQSGKAMTSEAGRTARPPRSRLSPGGAGHDEL